MLTSKRERGLLLALEGIDGSGTSTQAELLVRRLNQPPAAAGAAPAYLTHEPSDGTIGRLLRQALAKRQVFESATIALLFAADRLDHHHEQVEPRLSQGSHVVSDRHVYSSFAYQGVQQAERWVFSINERAPSPDLVVYLRVSPATAAQRRARRGAAEELFDAETLQRQIAARYDALLGAGPEQSTWRLHPQAGWRGDGPVQTAFGRRVESAMIDGELPVEAVHEQLWSLLTAKLRRRGEAKEMKAS